MPLYAPPLATSERYRAQMAAQSYFSESFPRQALSTSSAPATGAVYFVLIGLARGDVVTNLHLLCTTLGSGFSGIGMKVGLYSKAGVLLQGSGDVSALFASTGPKVCPLSAAYTVGATDGYLAALLAVASVPPTLLRGAPGQNASGAFAGGVGAYGVQNSQVDLPAPATVANNNGASAFWVGAS